MDSSYKPSLTTETTKILLRLAQENGYWKTSLNKVDYKGLSIVLELSTQTLRNWYSGKNEPTKLQLIGMVAILDVDGLKSNKYLPKEIS